MTIQKRNKTLSSLVVLLLITNLLVLGYFLCYKKPKAAPRMSFEESLKKEIGFSAAQMEAFQKINNIHKPVIEAKMDTIKLLKTQLFSLAATNHTTDSVVLQVVNHITQSRSQLEIQLYEQLVATRQLCTPDQMPVFDSVVVKQFKNMRKR